MSPLLIETSFPVPILAFQRTGLSVRALGSGRVLNERCVSLASQLLSDLPGDKPSK